MYGVVFVPEFNFAAFIFGKKTLEKPMLVTFSKFSFRAFCASVCSLRICAVGKLKNSKRAGGS